MNDGKRPIKRALVSVYDKQGLDELARGLHEAGVEIVSTGGSHALVAGLGIPVTALEELTGFPECLAGRVKTLHPKVHAGILADSRKEEHLQQLAELDIAPFDLVVVNLYPFAATVASGASVDECVEQIDIGGPTMVRAAAKNHPTVAVVTDPARYGDVLDAVRGGGFTVQQRAALARDAFVHTASYDVAVATWMGQNLVGAAAGEEETFPGWTGVTYTKAAALRYGENPHQAAALYTSEAQVGVAQGEQLHGKEMSYNNYVDADAAYRAAYDHGDVPTVAIIKHANPCGIAVGREGEDIADVHAKAHECDSTSAFGGIIATNRPVTKAMAETVKDIFTEVVIAPSFDDDALQVLTAKKNIRLVAVPAPSGITTETRPISGGLLVQQRDLIDAEGEGKDGQATGDAPDRWQLVAGVAADEATMRDLEFAWRAVRAVKSNAILLADDGASVGIGMGQVNRVDSCNLAVTRAGAQRARGSVAASDAFFPFADGPQILLDAGVRAIVAPGGSIRDGEVIEACEKAGVTLYFTGTRHFAH